MYRNIVEVEFKLVSLLDETMKIAKEATSQKVIPPPPNSDRKMKEQ